MSNVDHRFLRIPASRDYFFSCGPDQILEPYSSVALGSIEEYSSEEIANAINGLADISVVKRSPYLSVWRWANESRYIEIQIDGDNTSEDGVWIASLLALDCNFSDLIDLWSKLRQTHPAIYLHSPSCQMYTPCSFLEEVALSALSPAWADSDPAVRHFATELFERYRLASGFPRKCAAFWREKTPHMAASLFEIPPPLKQIRCKDVWHVSDWTLRVNSFDEEAWVCRLSYYAYPAAGQTVDGKYKSGFVVWVRLADAEIATEIAIKLDVLDR